MFCRTCRSLWRNGWTESHTREGTNALAMPTHPANHICQILYTYIHIHIHIHKYVIEFDTKRNGLIREKACTREGMKYDKKDGISTIWSTE